MEADLHLLSRYHRHGDAAAFQALVQCHAGMVHATAARVTQDAMLAQDVAQETFLALARSSGAAIQSVGAWLHHVAWQKARDMVRGESRRRNYEGAAAEQESESHAEVTWAELEPLLDEAIEALPAQTKSLLIARFFEGRTQQDLAKSLGVSQSTVSRALDLGIAELRSKLEARGVLCGVGLAGLLATHGAQAAPPAVIISLGKLALSGVGASAAGFTIPQIITSFFMTSTAKVTLVAAAAVLAAALIGRQMGGSKSDSSATDPVAKDSAVTASANDNNTQASLASKGSATSRPTPTSAPASFRPAATSASLGSPSTAVLAERTTKGPSAAMMAKLSSVASDKDFRAFLLRVYSLRDPEKMAAEIEQTLGLSLSAQDLARRMGSPTSLESLILMQMGMKQPEEMLSWMSMYDGNIQLMSEAALKVLFQQHPHLTAADVEATLAAGPNRDTVLSVLRARQDPFAEAARAISDVSDERARHERLWQLSNQWPKEKLAEGAKWAMQNLKGRDLKALLPRLVSYLCNDSPDEAIAVMGQIQDHELLASALTNSMHALVERQSRVGDVVNVIGRLQGKERASAIENLSWRWARVDQDGLIDWVNRLETPADFEAALPATLPNLSPENYAKAMNNLMTHLDDGLEAALIKAATPDMSKTTRTTRDIIQRLTRLPRYQQIGSGQSGNANLLWEAVNRIAAGWVRWQGGAPQEGAQWIDGLPFKTPADRAMVAGKLYEQWRLSNPADAAQWAAKVGVAAR